MTPIIQFSHVSRFYQTVIGVGDVHLDLPAGAYGLVGPNGSGKTTFINLLAGMLRPSIGEVGVFGVNPVKDRRVLRRIGLCAASDLLYPNVSGLQWVEYLVGLHGFSIDEAHDRAVATLIGVGMEANMRRPIGSYSLGMRQRTKLAQAIAHEPDLLILDEPFNGLDPIGRFELTSYLTDWISRGRSLILASHILHEVEAVTKAFLLIHGGRILASGDAADVRAMLSGFPAQIFVRGEGLPRIAMELSSERWFRGLDLSADQAEMTIRVSDKVAFLKRLVELANLPQVNVFALESPDGSLESAFEMLLRVHRGEHVAEVAH